MFETLERREITGGIRCGMCGVINWPTALCCMGCNTALDKRPPRMSKVVPYQKGDLSFSQSVARVFEVIDFILLVPASYGMLLAMMFVGTAPFFTMAIAGWFAAGCYLMRGFFRHSRGRLTDTDVSVLWWLTMAYNLVDMTIMWALAVQSENMAFYYLGLWPLLVVVFSAMALVSESRKGRPFSYD